MFDQEIADLGERCPRVERRYAEIALHHDAQDVGARQVGFPAAQHFGLETLAIELQTVGRRQRAVGKQGIEPANIDRARSERDSVSFPGLKAVGGKEGAFIWLTSDVEIALA